MGWVAKAKHFVRLLHGKYKKNRITFLSITFIFFNFKHLFQMPDIKLTHLSGIYSFIHCISDTEKY